LKLFRFVPKKSAVALQRLRLRVGLADFDQTGVDYIPGELNSGVNIAILAHTAGEHIQAQKRLVVEHVQVDFGICSHVSSGRNTRSIGIPTDSARKPFWGNPTAQAAFVASLTHVPAHGSRVILLNITNIVRTPLADVKSGKFGHFSGL
jgi:hypothetical protein